MRLYHLLLLILSVDRTQPSKYSRLGSDVLSFLREAITEYDGKGVPKMRQFNIALQTDTVDAQAAKSKADLIKKARKVENRLNRANIVPGFTKGPEDPLDKARYHMDPVLNIMKRRSDQDFRRRGRSHKNKYSSSVSASSEVEMMDWKEEWNQHWLQKKFEAINSTKPRGDVVNMVAARPWGVSCGDPNQHDTPWGTCMLPMECEAEYRIYRGDYFCGRTNFVCCALQYTNYDLYQGFDVSFDDSSFATDSAEKNINSKESAKDKKRAAKKRRRRQRTSRKRTIKRTIRKIIREMGKILNRAYRNGTTARKKKTKQLKKYIKDLKTRYRKERKAVKDIHETEMVKVDDALKRRLEQIRQMNKNFAHNSTFRDIVVNGTITKQGARMLIEAYPELEAYMDPRLNLRRSGGGVEDSWTEPKEYLEYDIEYGLLYS